jgi:hypothetical protein
MQRIRDEASAAGLLLTAHTIEDPGPGPGKPWKSGELSAAQAREFERMTAEYDDHQKKIDAYDHAQPSANRVDATLGKAKDILATFVAELSGKWHLNSADFVVGSAAVLMGRHASVLSRQAAELAKDAQRHLDHYLKSPGKAILSGTVGLGAGAATLALALAPVAAPVLLVGAGAVGVSIVGGMVADKVWDDVVPKGANKAIDGGLKAVGGGAKDAWNKVF